MNKQRVLVGFEPHQIENLRKLSEKTRVPVQVYIREGVDMVLKRYSDQKKRARK